MKNKLTKYLEEEKYSPQLLKHAHKYKLDQEELDTLHDIEIGTYKVIDLSDQERQELKAAAERSLSLKKSKNINIRINESDLTELKQRAEEAGIPYQTLIGTALHQIAKGKIQISI